MKLINAGFGNSVNSDRVIAVISIDSAPSKRIIAKAKENNMLIDATQGRKTHSVIVMDSDHIVASYLKPETILNRSDAVSEEDENYAE